MYGNGATIGMVIFRAKVYTIQQDREMVPPVYLRVAVGAMMRTTCRTSNRSSNIPSGGVAAVGFRVVSR